MKLCHLIGAMGATVKPILKEGDYLVAVDGGLRQIEDWGLEPHEILGDFDSLEKAPPQNATVLPCEKDWTDMEYALNLALDKGFRRFILQGGLGGRLDHSFANLQLLHRIATEGGRGLLLGDGQNATVICEDSISFPPDFQGYCSVFALNQEAKQITMKNLAYTVEDFTLSPLRPMGVSNEFIQGQSAQITVGQGAVLILWQGVQNFSQYTALLP